MTPTKALKCWYASAKRRGTDTEQHPLLKYIHLVLNATIFHLLCTRETTLSKWCKHKYDGVRVVGVNQVTSMRRLEELIIMKSCAKKERRRKVIELWQLTGLRRRYWFDFCWIYLLEFSAKPHGVGHEPTTEYLPSPSSSTHFIYKSYNRKIPNPQLFVAAESPIFVATSIVRWMDRKLIPLLPF